MSKLIVELPEDIHALLKQHAAADGKTLKTIVTSLVDRYVHQPSPRVLARATGLCGAWKDRRGARALVKNLRASRRWWIRHRG